MEVTVFLKQSIQYWQCVVVTIAIMLPVKTCCRWFLFEVGSELVLHWRTPEPIK